MILVISGFSLNGWYAKALGLFQTMQVDYIKEMVVQGCAPQAKNLGHGSMGDLRVTVVGVLLLSE